MAFADAGAVIHSHSKHVVYATLLYPGREFRVSNLEMIKGIRKDTTGKYYRYDEELVIPIIENTPEERDLEARLTTLRLFLLSLHRFIDLTVWDSFL